MKVALIAMCIALLDGLSVENWFMEKSQVNALLERALLLRNVEQKLLHHFVTEELVIQNFLIFG